MVTPLVPPDRLTAPHAYRQLSRQEADEQFRATLVDLLPVQTFTSLSQAIASEGAVSFAGLLTSADFDRFRQRYDTEMQTKGSSGALHSYLNITTSALLFQDPRLWEIVAHPLIVVLIAHALGGPVKIVDLRAKNTYPVDVVARDNTLHLDNSPFMDEYKLVATWTLGTTKGPTGQGLTYLPGTNRCFRDCFVQPDGSVWSDEDACIFPNKERVDEAIATQPDGLRVVHLSDLDAPCHTIFAASRLVHHRYRTSAGASRSSVMASYHRIDDSDEFLYAAGPTQPLQQLLLTGGSSEQFLAAVCEELPTIKATLERTADLVVDAKRHTLTGTALDEWYARQRKGVTLNNLRSQRMRSSASGTMDWLVERLQYDLQGPLNMPFFADGRESRRKRARIRLREMSSVDIREVLAPAYARITPATGEQAASIAELSVGLRDLDRLLQSSTETDDAVVRSLPDFVSDLRITIGWLEPSDHDSIITAAAIALLAAALTEQCHAMGDTGQQITNRLMRRYLALVRGTA